MCELLELLKRLLASINARHQHRQQQPTKPGRWEFDTRRPERWRFDADEPVPKRWKWDETETK